MSSLVPEYEDKASLVQSKEGQAVRLPKACRFEGAAEVAIRKVGDEVVLSPVRRTWKQYFACSSRPTQDFVDAVLNRKDPPVESQQIFD